ncbi:hypothetical protein Tco_0273049 [Tanacetum coccineum]
MLTDSVVKSSQEPRCLTALLLLCIEPSSVFRRLTVKHITAIWQRFRRHHSEQPESIHDTYAVEKDDSKVIPDSSNVCDNDNKVDQNAEECDDERVVLANLITNLKLDIDENKRFKSFCIE